VPYSLPVDGKLPEQEAAANSLIEQARVQGGRRVTGHWEKVRGGQAGRRIIEEAEDMRATAIVMGLPRRVAGASLFGKTLETVLADRPCRVVIETNPALAPARGAYASAVRAEVAG
jgi:basic amino acid/polyamine antiporter, APA family